MIYCPECGEENPDGSKFCRKCGVNLVYDEPKKETTAKKVTVEIDEGPIRPKTVNTNYSNTNTSAKKDNDDKWCWGCCICMFFLFIIFAIAGH
ncbi:MAG: zinc-ribbon domain-containing protein [Methanobrevibacter millerae]|uniref:Zinc-ribbon domain-containing protein n=1 Tax=Methanobrevibacter millerae TaxID=230361 RepID=A0A8T3VJS7_9EURY|nr:zinc-ribbon domain-containing protein [Methanobrevibacter millerae]